MKNETLNPLFEVMKQETLQTVVHDLRTPMTVIKGYLHLLLSGTMGDMSDDQKMLIQRSVAPLEDLILLTENLLQAATLDKNGDGLKFSDTDLDGLLSETIDFYQLPFQQRKMSISREGNTLGLRISVDAFWMRRVLHNLIWNAYKFTPDKGKVGLRVHHQGKGLEIIVEDTGRGIPADKLEKIFDKFEQVSKTKDRKLGTGLGLWICKRVMELHGGTIRAQSAENQGSRFILYLPPQRIS